MSRTVPAAIITALAQSNVQPFYAVYLGLTSAPLRLWTGSGDRTIGGHVYTGAGTLMKIGGLEEITDLTAVAVDLTLSGISSSIISLALDEPYQNRIARIYFGVRDVSDVVEVFSGYINTMSIEDQDETCTISLTVDSKLVMLERPRVRRYTHESHAARYPGDTFFSYVADLADKEIAWGRKAK